jgi:hypothetical protein
MQMPIGLPGTRQDVRAQDTRVRTSSKSSLLPKHAPGSRGAFAEVADILRESMAMRSPPK